MLYEVKKVSQSQGNLRRWFTDEGMDLIVWISKDDASELIGFDLCYDKETKEHVLRWDSQKGIIHRRIDAGNDLPGRHGTPILVADGALPIHRLTSDFEARSANLPPQFKDAVSKVLKFIEGHGS